MPADLPPTSPSCLPEFNVEKQLTYRMLALYVNHRRFTAAVGRFFFTLMSNVNETQKLICSVNRES